MIAVFLQDLKFRLAALLVVALVLYALEPGFHQHEGMDPAAVALGPLGVSATLSNLAALSMIILLGGFISTDRREGYTRIALSHATPPLAYYGLKWALAYLLAIVLSLLFLVVGQVIAWGTYEGGLTGMVLPVLSALIAGGMLAFFSTVLPRGDTWAVFLLLIAPVLFPQLLSLGLSSLNPSFRRFVDVLLPPQNALASLWDSLLLGSFDWEAAAFAAAYGLLFLLAGALILRLREWP